MTKGELRRARKAERAAGRPLTGELAVRDDSNDVQIFTETYRGRKALDRWARRYESLNGAPENDGDR